VPVQGGAGKKEGREGGKGGGCLSKVVQGKRKAGKEGKGGVLSKVVQGRQCSEGENVRLSVFLATSPATPMNTASFRKRKFLFLASLRKFLLP
jgi:hypothetical protein